MHFNAHLHTRQKQKLHGGNDMPVQVHQLEAEFAILEETRSALAGDVLPALTEAVARLNDTHILQVRLQTGCSYTL